MPLRNSGSIFQILLSNLRKRNSPVNVTKNDNSKEMVTLTGKRVKIRKRETFEPEYLDSSWKKHRQKYSGWTAQIIQHEMDHLEGIII